MGKIRIGISGLSYNHGEQKIFPEDLPSSKRLYFHATLLPTLEINSTFYHMPKQKTVEKWGEETPTTFKFAIKANKAITHTRRLSACKDLLELFLSRIIHLKRKLGPILFQLPPSFKKDIETLQQFISLLPPKWLFTFEFRHTSWFDDEVYALLKKHNIALCYSHLAGKLWPQVCTANFIYIRLHGPSTPYKDSYSLEELTIWAQRILEWKKEKSTDIYLYFDNDILGFAIPNALTLMKLIRSKKIGNR